MKSERKRVYKQSLTRRRKTKKIELLFTLKWIKDYKNQRKKETVLFTVIITKFLRENLVGEIATLTTHWIRWIQVSNLFL